ncbi:Frataxin-like domain-containing protein [Gaertneriomyces semiglobifer]|nr:Frataxin-like domain-containing protein [Gaertneriomyces semiglobifer]
MTRLMTRRLVGACRQRLSLSSLAAGRCTRTMTALSCQNRRPPFSRENFLMRTPQLSMSFSAQASHNAEAFDEKTYHTVADETMDNLLEQFEVLLDDNYQADASFDVVYNSGVLTLVLGDAGTYVINKQPPNKQIWVSSPKSGPKRFDFSIAKHHWICGRTDEILEDMLSQELSDILRLDVQITLPDPDI